MFSTDFESLRLEALRRPPMSLDDTVMLVRLSSPPPREAMPGLYLSGRIGCAGELDFELLRRAKAAKSGHYHGSVTAIVPIYVTSFCQERCLYCNYRAENRNVELQRLRLSPEQLEHEVRFLIEQKGLRNLELVYATDPNVRVDTICTHVEMVRSVLNEVGGGSVGINAEPFDVDEYRKLVDAGLDFAVIWQETYDPQLYRALHPGKTKKANMAYRLDGCERMLEAGLNTFGMGVLSGLGDWRHDWAMLAMHEAYLEERYGVGPSILGIPRLKAAAGAKIQQTPFIPSDHELTVAVAAHNLFRPRTMPFVSTREKWDLCLALAQGGGCLFTFNCSTIPGGYSLGSHGYQFPTASYDTDLFVPKIRGEGFTVDFHWPSVGLPVDDERLHPRMDIRPVLA
jgi:2-iminoacetate synthase